MAPARKTDRPQRLTTLTWLPQGSVQGADQYALQYALRQRRPQRAAWS
jgi:hypothetical protein